MKSWGVGGGDGGMDEKLQGRRRCWGMDEELGAGGGMNEELGAG